MERIMALLMDSMGIHVSDEGIVLAACRNELVTLEHYLVVFRYLVLYVGARKPRIGRDECSGIGRLRKVVPDILRYRQLVVDLE